MYHNRMQTGNKFRIYPTPEQQQILLRWIGCQRFIYNAKVGEDRYFRRFSRKSPALCGVPIPRDQQYAHFITEQTAFLREVPAVLLRNGAYRWRQAYQRFFSGACQGRPKIKSRKGRQSVLLTRELFELSPHEDGIRLAVGSKKFPLGEIPVRAHRPVEKTPASIILSVESGQWHLSFAVEDGAPERTEAQIAAELQRLGEAALLRAARGIDRGVAIPAAVCDGSRFDFSPIQKKRLAGAERHRKRWQKIAARREKGSRRRTKAHQRAARYALYEARVRSDMAHKASRTLVDDLQARLFVFEDLRTKNMTRSAKGSIEKPGRNVRQKAGLNRAILHSAWGRIHQFTRYKARRMGKLAIVVPPHHSSQECRLCGFTAPGNRLSQAEFACQRCGHAENADFNAAGVVKFRGVRLLLAGEIEFKTPRRSGIRKQLGPERSEVTPGEKVSVVREPTPRTPSSLNRETPTTTPVGV